MGLHLHAFMPAILDAFGVTERRVACHARSFPFLCASVRDAIGGAVAVARHTGGCVWGGLWVVIALSLDGTIQLQQVLPTFAGMPGGVDTAQGACLRHLVEEACGRDYSVQSGGVGYLLRQGTHAVRAGLMLAAVVRGFLGHSLKGWSHCVAGCDFVYTEGNMLPLSSEQAAGKACRYCPSYRLAAHALPVLT